MDEQALRDRIDRWQAAGLIDAATADRLRVAEATEPLASGSTAAAVLGPSVTVVEMFAYLGTAFLLAAVAAVFARISSGSNNAEAILGVGAGVEAIALAVIGLVLRSGTPRRRRAAGISFLVAVVAAGAAVNLFGSTVGVDGQVVAIFSTGAALAVAVAFRLILPALTTELAVLGTITALSSSLLVWIQGLVAPLPYYGDNVLVTSPGADPLILVLGSAIWWLATAFLLGIMGLMEAHRGRMDPAAQRRAGVVRLWAALTAVLGLFYAVTQTATGSPEAPVRTIPPVIGDVAVLVIAAILLQRAYRRESNAYIFAAAIGCIAALTDLDGSYLSSTPDVALLLEGVILIVIGFGAQVLRRRVLVPAPVGPATAAPA